MHSIKPSEVATKDLHGYLLGGVGPRPIALASTMDEHGNPNLSPFSFFNVFSANPPIAIFSPARRVRNNTIKHTLENCRATKEVVINAVSYDIVEQVSLSSTEYPAGVNEFRKAGLTPMKSETIRPHRVKESPFHLECQVNDIIELGNQGGAGNLIVCEVKMLHVSESVLDANGKIDQDKIDLVGRLGGNWYSRGSGDALFEVAKPLTTMGIGVDNIPSRIRNSYILTGNDLGKLGNVEEIPDLESIENFSNQPEIQQLLDRCNDGEEQREALHSYAKDLLDRGLVQDAWKTLLLDKLNRA